MPFHFNAIPPPPPPLPSHPHHAHRPLLSQKPNPLFTPTQLQACPKTQLPSVPKTRPLVHPNPTPSPPPPTLLQIFFLFSLFTDSSWLFAPKSPPSSPPSHIPPSHIQRFTTGKSWKEYFIIKWAGLRSMLDPSFAERTMINYSDFLTQVTLITSCATKVTESEVLTADDRKIPYDYLVIATGHINTDPMSKNEALRICQAAHEKIKSSNSILIVGGGPTGVELVGEIYDKFPDKKITLVHLGPRLLEFIGSRASQKALDWMASKKIEVILDQSVNLKSATEGVYKTSGGDTIVADCYFNCTGNPLGSSWLRDTIVKGSLDIQGRLAVDRYLRVKGCKNIFAIGDITNLPELKQGYLAQRHADLTAKNLKLLLQGESEDKMHSYKPGRPMAFVSLGRKDGIAQLNCFTFSGIIPSFIKSADLFVGRTRKTYGLK